MRHLKFKTRIVFIILIFMPIILLFNNSTTALRENFTKTPVEIPLADIFNSVATSALNSKYNALPKVFSSFPLNLDGSINYSKGGAFLIGANGLYQSGQSFSSSGLLVLPPADSFDFIKVNFTKPGQTELDQNFIWYLSGTYGIQKAQSNYSQGVRVQIVVAGDPIDSTDAKYAVVDDFIVTQKNTISRKSSFGTWPLRKNFYFSIQVSTLGSGNINENLIIDGLTVKSNNRRPWLGIAQSNLLWDQNYNSIISGISTAGSKWIRTNLSTSSNAPFFTKTVLAANQTNLKVLAIIMPEYYEDYTDPANSIGNADSTQDGPFKKKCGFSTGALKVSMIDIELFSARLENNLKYLKSASANIDAFEIGNELDWVCFNGDITLGTKPIATNLPQQFYIKYAQMLKESKRLISIYFPTSQVLSFGTANPGLFGSVDSYVQDPQNILASLTFLNNVNYLQYVDAIGIHLYPGSASAADIYNAKKTISNYSNISNASKPIWITEFGFYSVAKNFSAIRYSGIRFFIELINSFTDVSISSLFLYTYSLPGDGFSFVDTQGNIEPSIRIVNQYNQLLVN